MGDFGLHLVRGLIGTAVSGPGLLRGNEEIGDIDRSIRDMDDVIGRVFSQVDFADASVVLEGGSSVPDGTKVGESEGHVG